MNRHLFKFMFCLYISTLTAACASRNNPIVPTPVPITPTRMPATATLATSTSSPVVLPTFSFNNSTPFATRPSPTPITPIPTAPEGNPFHLVAEIDEIIPGSQWADIQSAQDDSVWLLTDQGIARVTDSGWTVYLSSFEGYLVGIDSTNRIWVVNETGDSISAWDGTKWTKYTSEDGWEAINYPPAFISGLPGGHVWTVSLVELPGQVWLSTDLDVRVFDGTRWKIVSLEEMGMTPLESREGPSSHPSLMIKSVQSTGEIWVGQCDYQSSDSGQGVRWFDGNTWHGKSTSMGSGCISAIQEDSKGNIWIGMSRGANEGLWRYDRKTHEWADIKRPDRHEHISDLAFDPTDELWMLGLSGGGAAHSQSLYHLQEGVWMLSVADDGPITQTRHILFDSAGRVWMAGARGIYRIVDNQPQLVTEIPLNLYFNFDKFDWTMDSAGRIWLVDSTGFHPEGPDDRVSLWVATP